MRQSVRWRQNDGTWMPAIALCYNMMPFCCSPYTRMSAGNERDIIRRCYMRAIRYRRAAKMRRHEPVMPA